MIRFEVLSGKQAGSVWSARRFPVTIGRSRPSNFQAQEDGVWDRHLRIEFDPQSGLVLHPFPDALVSVNDEPVRETVLHNGDIISLGALRLRFSLSDTVQRGLGLRETLTWLGIAAITLAQIFIIYRLLP